MSYISSEMFNLREIPALWTALLGEHNREEEAGYEQRISVEKIVVHEHYENFKNDIAMLKLTRPALISVRSQVTKICLPPDRALVPNELNFKTHRNTHSSLDMFQHTRNNDNNITRTAKQYVMKILEYSSRVQSMENRKNDKFSNYFTKNTLDKKVNNFVLIL